MVLARPDERETWPYHWSLRLFAVVRRSSCGPIACWILARTSSLVTWSLYEMCSICLLILIHKHHTDITLKHLYKVHRVHHFRLSDLSHWHFNHLLWSLDGSSQSCSDDDDEWPGSTCRLFCNYTRGLAILAVKKKVCCFWVLLMTFLTQKYPVCLLLLCHLASHSSPS